MVFFCREIVFPRISVKLFRCLFMMGTSLAFSSVQIGAVQVAAGSTGLLVPE